jgi:hypothetical protein
VTDLPTAKQLWEMYVNEGLEEVDEEITPDDYENHFTTVFKMPDGRFVQIAYTADGQGNYNSWRDDPQYLSPPHEVFPHLVTTTAFKPYPPKE